MIEITRDRKGPPLDGMSRYTIVCPHDPPGVAGQVLSVAISDDLYDEHGARIVHRDYMLRYWRRQHPDCDCPDPTWIS
jgi:hypothetical protein